jgi:hypothetical protein
VRGKNDIKIRSAGQNCPEAVILVR